ncbi:MAG: hypothetical protein EBY21_01380 [Alphaproteobacteria bacterium]|nr:hypothetical protein [Alphaproteobacteria bacterium]
MPGVKVGDYSPNLGDSQWTKPFLPNPITFGANIMVLSQPGLKTSGVIMPMQASKGDWMAQKLDENLKFDSTKMLNILARTLSAKRSSK